MDTKIIFVYNADSGFFNLLGDIARKTFSPQTYQCNLCAITHGNLGMRGEWREYLKTLDVPFEFLHADEFRKKYRVEAANLPAVFELKDDNLVSVINSDEIDACRSISDLTRLVNSQVNRQT